jgi:lipoprotein NlpD
MDTIRLQARRLSSHPRLGRVASGLFRACGVWLLLLILIPVCSVASNPSKATGKAPTKTRTKAPAKPKGVTHVVAKGQTLFRIAQAYEVKVAVLADANKIKPWSPLKIGQRLFVPGATAARAVEAYTPLTTDERTRLERSLQEQPTEAPPPPPVPSPGVRVKTDAEFVWPLVGPINSPFGPRWGKFHAGIDIGSPHYQEVVSAADGEVIYAADTRGPLGKAVVIQHGHGVRTVYAHLSIIVALESRTVRQGQAIGGVGNTGRSTGPHLHFEIRQNGAAINPEEQLPATIDELVKDLARPR